MRLLKDIKRWYMRMDRQFISKVPKPIRIYAPLVAAAMLFIFDTSILVINNYITSKFSTNPITTEIYIKTFLILVIVVFSPKQLIRLIKRLK